MMFSTDRTLSLSLLVSLIFHLFIFLPLPILRYQPQSRSELPLEVTYVVLAQAAAKKTPPAPKPANSAQDTAASTKLTVQAQAVEPPPIPTPVIQSAPAVIPAKSEAETIEIPPDLPKEKEGTYIDYYQSIREKIRLFVEKNYPRFIDYGEVCLYFVLQPNGKLAQMQVLKERSTANNQLIDIVKRSVKQAAPFPAFPQNLSSEQLSFNVTVSFERAE
ncbi:MAG: hypothetical protein V1727_03225 [Candidatus Omnitrophota bacterium]